MVPAGVEAFFLDADPGKRFAVYRSASHGAHRGAVLYVHAFAEEMNKSRRMAAMQARAFARAGYAVLQIDLFGCGDSDGQLIEARWDLWKRDLEIASGWLASRGLGPVHLWGLRLGATLALSHWCDVPGRYRSAVLWQPVIDGRAFVTQFLRVAVARHAIRGGATRTTTEAMREVLAERGAIEIAGYALSAELASAIDAQNLREWHVPGGRVNWLEIRASASDASLATLDTIAAWRSRGVEVDFRGVEGENFWSSIDVFEAETVLDVTTSLYASPAPASAALETMDSR